MESITAWYWWNDKWVSREVPPHVTAIQVAPPMDVRIAWTGCIDDPYAPEYMVIAFRINSYLGGKNYFFKRV